VIEWNALTRRQLLKAAAAGTIGLGVASRWALEAANAAGPSTSALVYDDFSDGGASYTSKWVVFPGAEPQALATRSFAGGELGMQATPFVTSTDGVADHSKYLALSTQSFALPQSGSLSVSAVISAQTPGTSPGHVVPSTGRILLESQQAAATLHLIDLSGTGVLFDWFISEHKAFPLYERLFLTVGLDKGFTQIPGDPNTNHGFSEPFEPKTFASQDFDISPGPHLYGIRYTRNGQGPDTIAWLLDGDVRAQVHKIGVPLDVQNGGFYSASHTITYPSAGPGEELRDQLTGFQIAHGMFTLVDEWPFRQFPYNDVSIPTSERIWGQGCAATYDAFTVTTSSTPKP
jgi:hypothetical protein